MTTLLALGITVVLAITEYQLCTKFENPFWGGIVPLLVLIVTIYVFAVGIMLHVKENIFPFVVLNLLMLGNWMTGRDAYKKLKQAELEKMKARDIE